MNNIKILKHFDKIPENLTYEEIIDHLKFKFPLEKWKLSCKGVVDDAETTIDIEDEVAIVRTDIKKKFGIVGSEYGISHYNEAFSIIAPLIEDKEAYPIYGKLINDGQKAKIILKGNKSVILGTEKIDGYFTVHSSHDGRSKIVINLTPISNFSDTIYLIGRTIEIKHSKNVSDYVANASKILRIIHKEWEEFEADIGKMVTIKIPDERAIDYFKEIIGDSDSTKSQNMREEIFKLWKYGTSSKVPICDGTLFGAYTAFCVWVDSDTGKVVRKSKKFDPIDAAIEARMTGAGAKQKTEAYALALNIMETFK